MEPTDFGFRFSTQVIAMNLAFVDACCNAVGEVLSLWHSYCRGVSGKDCWHKTTGISIYYLSSRE